MTSLDFKLKLQVKRGAIHTVYTVLWISPVAKMVKNPPAMQETWLRSLGWEDPLEKEMATHSSILAWRIPWTVWSIGSQELDTTE